MKRITIPAKYENNYIIPLKKIPKNTVNINIVIDIPDEYEIDTLKGKWVGLDSTNRLLKDREREKIKEDEKDLSL
ncbi:MAG: hypothetical protein DRH57_04370 [Candidatus Cloacimonadota bacterium]|nr:MAG: hypothetical protein DRH57_04370 [Candidatus Cloacimonadota bacterium]